MPVIWAFYCLHFYTCTSMLIGFSFCLWEYVGKRGEGFFARRWGNGGSEVLWSNKIFCVCVCVCACASQTGSWSGSKTLLLRKLTSWSGCAPESTPAEPKVRSPPPLFTFCFSFVFLVLQLSLCEKDKRPWLDAPWANPPWTILKSL